mmetsp:Transcript_62603/g.132285  ORF Transcript_62603/g.132285 Transcript_62603/m.132285 type:complete len:279 (-) Transcript_62603:112-948(-)
MDDVSQDVHEGANSHPSGHLDVESDGVIVEECVQGTHLDGVADDASHGGDQQERQVQVQDVTSRLRQCEPAIHTAIPIQEGTHKCTPDLKQVKNDDCTVVSVSILVPCQHRPKPSGHTTAKDTPSSSDLDLTLEIFLGHPLQGLLVRFGHLGLLLAGALDYSHLRLLTIQDQRLQLLWLQGSHDLRWALDAGYDTAFSERYIQLVHDVFLQPDLLQGFHEIQLQLVLVDFTEVHILKCEVVPTGHSWKTRTHFVSALVFAIVVLFPNSLQSLFEASTF